MKIKKIFTSIPFIVGFFLIIYAGFGFVYIQKQSEWREIDEQLAPIRTTLDRTTGGNIATVEDKLDDAEQAYEQAWATLPHDDQGIDLYDSLVEVARLTSVDLVSITAAQPKTEAYQGNNYAVISYNLNVKGSKTNVLNFVSSLADGPLLLQTCRITNLVMTTTESETATCGCTATMQLSIYTTG